MQSVYAVNLFDFAFAPSCCHCAPISMQSHCRTFKIVVKHAWTGTTVSQCVRRREYTQPSLIRPFLIRSPSSTGHLPSDVAMVNMVLTCRETHMLGHVRKGACTVKSRHNAHHRANAHPPFQRQKSCKGVIFLLVIAQSVYF